MAGSKISRSPTRWSFEKEVGDIYAKFIAGATGAVSSFKGAGVKSVVRNSTGNYTITLSATFQRLLMVSGIVSSATAKNVGIQLFGTPANVQTNFLANGTVTVQLTDNTGAAVDPANGDHVWIKMEVRFNPSKVFD